LVKDDIVCRCNLVTVEEVKAFYLEYPGLPPQVHQQALNIGTRCGCCRRVDCPNIDIHFTEVIKNLQISK
jgi:bacterioferritin-associated ferredoxin